MTLGSCKISPDAAGMVVDIVLVLAIVSKFPSVPVIGGISELVANALMGAVERSDGSARSSDRMVGFDG